MKTENQKPKIKNRKSKTEKLKTEKLKTKKLKTEKLKTEKSKTKKLKTEKSKTEKLRFGENAGTRICGYVDMRYSELTPKVNDADIVILIDA